MKMSPYRVVLFCLAAALPAVAEAGEEVHAKPIGVVELFTSQGCSSCPRADAAIERIAASGRAVTISYHIDYWNYLGWPDTLAAKENTERQYAYARTLGNNNVFTPQIVLNGVENAKTTSATVILSDLEKMNREGLGAAIDVDADVSKDEMTITVGPGTGRADVVMAYFKQETTVAIGSGENAGRKVTYRNAVTKMETVGMWEGKPLTIRLPAALMSRKNYDGCAVLLQAHDDDGNPGRIYGAAMLEDYDTPAAQKER